MAPPLRPTVGETLSAFVAPLATTGLAVVAGDALSETDVVMLYAGAVTLVAFRSRLVASLVAAAGSALAFNFFFTAPYYTLYVDDSHYWFTFFMLAALGALVAVLASRLRIQTEGLALRERLSRALFTFTRELAVAETPGDARRALDRYQASLHLLDARAAATDAPPWMARDVDVATTLLEEHLARRSLREQEALHRMAVEAERLRSTLLSGVSHDLRTPLAGITGAATTLLDPDVALGAEARRELLEHVATEAERLRRLLDNVLRMTRLDSGELQPNLAWELPFDLVQAAAARVRRRSDRAVRVRAPGAPVLARLDPVLFDQLVENYLDNAVRYTPATQPIDVTLEVVDAELHVHVQDAGAGFGDQPVDRLFEKFVRGDRSSGSGLGLAICRAIATLHGGRTWAGAARQGGAVFSASFPLGGPDGEPVPRFDELLLHTELV